MRVCRICIDPCRNGGVQNLYLGRCLCTFDWIMFEMIIFVTRSILYLKFWNPDLFQILHTLIPTRINTNSAHPHSYKDHCKFCTPSFLQGSIQILHTLIPTRITANSAHPHSYKDQYKFCHCMKPSDIQAKLTLLVCFV
jgi:hypothetical protein